MSKKLYEFNPGKKSWLMYTNTVKAISGDDITIETQNNNKIIFKENDISYSIDNFAKLNNDASFNKLDVCGNLSISGDVYINGNLAQHFTTQITTPELENSVQYYIPLVDGVTYGEDKTLHDLILDLDNSVNILDNRVNNHDISINSLEVSMNQIFNNFNYYHPII